MLRKLLRSRKGQGLVEYALLVAGVSLACILGVSLLGEKTGDMIAAVAAVLPGADADDNGPITVGHLVEDTRTSGGPIQLDLTTIKNGGQRMDQNLGDGAGSGTSFSSLVIDPDGT
jgi:Flp pilus assembly pilin Flp